MAKLKVSLTEEHARFIYQVLSESVSVSGKESAQQLLEMIDAFETALGIENL